ncbi:MAG: nucleoside 2-deoxyribosyltransferase, partial [Planctomycetaceae bacterium]
MPKDALNGRRVYCAGPLFNQAERSEMEAIADRLIAAGHRVYVPHRDGMEFRLILEILVERGWPAPQAAEFLHAAIFALDVYQLAVECDSMVWNLNGRTPDEGAVSEAAMAWTLGKPIVAYKDDVRSLIAGRVNPLLVGMVDFLTVEDVAAIPAALQRAIAEHSDCESVPVSNLAPRMQRAVREGRKLWLAMTQRSAQYNDELIAQAVE